MKFIWIQVNKVGLTKQSSSYCDLHFVANDPIKLNNIIKVCLINLNIFDTLPKQKSYHGMLSCILNLQISILFTVK